ncbi:hypothetical protein SAMN03097694_2386 [Janthinobacterium lividum]|uniref:Uncharacterized protein n=1 Tax=Janthinobacterium lividum TaxID=29581 RepID=A0AB38C7F8_9BURK|nr:hypothetical protein SAMN03097694_2386 [Janthinobacterium lividum]
MSWDNEFVLRSVVVTPDEAKKNCYFIYRHSHKVDALTSANAVFDSPPREASMKEYVAVPLNPPRQWEVKLELPTPIRVMMGVFQLRKR